MKIPINPLRTWALCMACMFLGWYSSHLIPVDPELNYMELKATRAIHEGSILALADCASIQEETTGLIYELNDLITGRKRLTVNINAPTRDLPLSQDAGEVQTGVINIGMGLVFQRETLRFILSHIKHEKGLTDTP